MEKAWIQEILDSSSNENIYDNCLKGKKSKNGEMVSKNLILTVKNLK